VNDTIINPNDNKRKFLIYTVIFLWIAMGILAYKFYNSNFTDLAAYFISLTGFVGSYIWGESVRKSDTTSIYKKGKTSSREKMVYVAMLLWTVAGTFSILKNLNLNEIAAYFAALTPFIGAYMLGETYKPEKKETKE
jgi:hypothetical protein